MPTLPKVCRSTEIPGLQIQPTRSTRSIPQAVSRQHGRTSTKLANAAKYTAAERRTIQSRIRKAARARKVELPDPDEFVELMKEVRRRNRAEE